MSIKKIRFLQVQFENEIEPWEVPAFRGAIIATVGKEHILFHNHEKESFRYGYPLIQYKEINRKPMIISLDEGIEEIHFFFQNMQIGLMLGVRPYELRINKLLLDQITLKISEFQYNYSIRNWIALNQENYQSFISITSLAEKLTFLEKTLTGNILSFAKGVGWTIDQPIIVKVTQFDNPKSISLKGRKILGFNIKFSSNVLLPDLIGLGKSSALGFGLVRSYNKTD